MLVQKSIESFDRSREYWLRETQSSKVQIVIDNLQKLLMSEGHRHLAFNMLTESRLKWAIANKLAKFFGHLAAFYKSVRARNEITVDQAVEAQIISRQHENMIETYNELKGIMEKGGDPHIAYENGDLTIIENHKKLYESVVHWIGKEEQWEYHNLYSAYFESNKHD